MSFPERRYEDFEYAVGRGFDERVQRWAVAFLIRPAGGEEFAVLFDPDRAAEAAAKLRAEVEIVRSSGTN